ncbi:MAG: hypothetical protein J0L92_19615 [Deltaproteobacteria bacterium]|nr:hypothetical protein [Deltaproteobacteria bacterium]
MSHTHRLAIPLVVLFVSAAFLTPASRASAQYVQAQVQAQPQSTLMQPQEAQSVTTTRSRPNLGLIIPGAVLLGVGWVFNFIVGLPAGDDPFDGSPPDERWNTFRGFSLIPAIGPWVQLAVQPSGFNSDYWGMWLILNGVLQTTGLVLLIVGIATPSEEVTTTTPYVTVVPVVSGDQVGAAMLGTF